MNIIDTTGSIKINDTRNNYYPKKWVVVSISTKASRKRDAMRELNRRLRQL